MTKPVCRRRLTIPSSTELNGLLSHIFLAIYYSELTPISCCLSDHKFCKSGFIASLTFVHKPLVVWLQRRHLSSHRSFHLSALGAHRDIRTLHWCIGAICFHYNLPDWLTLPTAICSRPFLHFFRRPYRVPLTQVKERAKKRRPSMLRNSQPDWQVRMKPALKRKRGERTMR